MKLERSWDNFIFEIGKYTLIPGILTLLVKIPNYNERIVFVIFVILNWIVLTEFKMRDISRKIKNGGKERK